MLVRLTKLMRCPGGLESDAPLRTESVEGTTFGVSWPPSIDEPVTVLAKPLDPLAHFRIVATSLVIGVISTAENIVQFITPNSVYELEKLED